MRNRVSIVWHKAHSLWFELCLGVYTRGAVPAPTNEGVHYTPLPYPMIFRMLKRLNLKASDVFVDIGCGKGRVVCCACRLPITKVVALELNGELLNQALANVKRVRGRKAPVSPVWTSAEDYEYADATVIYLYNPFNARLTQLVLERLFLSYTTHPRTMRVVYANPIHQAVFEKQSWLKKYDEWAANDLPGFGCPISFWRSVDTQKVGPPEPAKTMA